MKVKVPNINCIFQGARITKASHFDYEYVLGHKVSYFSLSFFVCTLFLLFFKPEVILYQKMILNAGFKDFLYKK